MKYCPKCQVETERYKGGDCKPCARVRAAVCRKLNPEKLKANNAAYRAANIETIKEYRIAYRAKNNKKLVAKDKKYSLTNAGRKAANARAWYALNRAMATASRKNYNLRNPDNVIVCSHNRRARKLEAGGKLSAGLAAKLVKLQRGKCACGCKQPLGDDYHLDHIMPLALGGANTDDNIQLLRKLCNLQKSAKHPVDFMQSRGFLL